MPGLVPGIYAFLAETVQSVDGRDKPGHDGLRLPHSHITAPHFSTEAMIFAMAFGPG